MVVTAHALEDLIFEAEPQDVRLDIFRVAQDAWDRAEFLSEELGIEIVLCEFLLPVHEGDEPTGGKDAHLSHATTKHLSVVSCRLDVFFASHDQAADWTAHTFAHTDRNQVKVFKHVLHFHA